MSGRKPTDDLYTLVKTKLEEDGVLRQVRCMMQTGIVNLLKGSDDENSAIVQRPMNILGCGLTPDVRIRLLNQLILEYFKWRGYTHSAKMLARESDIENVVPARDCLEGMIGRRGQQQQELPILLEIISDLYERKREHNEA